MGTLSGECQGYAPPQHRACPRRLTTEQNGVQMAGKKPFSAIQIFILHGYLRTSAGKLGSIPHHPESSNSDSSSYRTKRRFSGRIRTEIARSKTQKRDLIPLQIQSFKVSAFLSSNTVFLQMSYHVLPTPMATFLRVQCVQSFSRLRNH